MSTDSGAWLQREAARPGPGPRLVCFPHAGGSATLLRGWAEHLPDVEVYTVRYPGRADRIAEPAPTDLRELAYQIADAVQPLADRPLALFGHSMGAAVALETARELERRGVRLAHLFASGSREGELPAPDECTYSEDPDVVAEQLVSLGGTDPELAADPMFRELVLPYVISDSRMFHAYRMTAGPVLTCPVTTLVGDDDEDADRRPWRRLTTGRFREVNLPGGHFYLVTDPPVDVLTTALAQHDGDGDAARTHALDASARIQTATRDKRLGRELSADVTQEIVADYLAERVPDHQMAAWLATIACRSMSIAETAALTRAYLTGGERLDLREVDGPVVDKHSTGGVGDKVSLVVVPLVAACGLSAVKMSGRGLGHAGGTIDKLESIAGLRLDLAPAEVYSVLRQTGMVITGQSPSLAPGDGATYGLRDVTGTVDSIPLIAASIMSKKLAVGADGLVLDVKTGAGALIPEPDQARLLARTMVDLAGMFGLRCRAVLGDMSQPLGYAVGNALEVREALAVLRGAQVPGVSETCALVARLMLQSVQPDLDDAAADERIRTALASGAAYERFLRWASAQGADPRVLADPDRLPTAPHRVAVTADRDGWVRAVDPRAIGAAAVRVGAGRLHHGADLDHSAGIMLHHRVGDEVAAGDVLAEVHHRDGDVATALRLTRAAFTIGPLPPGPSPRTSEALVLE